MSAPHYGDRPVASWRYDPDERDALSYTLGLYRRARVVGAARSPRPRAVVTAPPPAASAQLSLNVHPNAAAPVSSPAPLDEETPQRGTTP